MKKIIVLIVLGSILMNVSCERIQSSDEITEKKQEQLNKELNSQTGMPSVVNATMKKQLKMIIEECDRPNLVCYAYTVNLNGEKKFFGKCIGYGVPYATQYTNPQKIAESYPQGGFAILSQADPDGLFKPTESSATWLMMINPKNPDDIKPVYIEPTIIVSPFEL